MIIKNISITKLQKSCPMYFCRFIFFSNQQTYVTNLGGNMARSTQFPIMITRSTIIYEIISPGAAGSGIYV